MTLEQRVGSEAQAKEEHHVVVPDNTWEMLPDNLVDHISNVLSVESLKHFYRVCQGWRNSIRWNVSGHPRLVFYHLENLIVYNPNNGRWESSALRFLPLNRLGPFSLVASAGGLLCFTNYSCLEFVVCNPVTETFTVIPMPWGKRNSSEACMPIVLQTFHKSRCDSVKLTPTYVIGMIVDVAGWFKLIVGCRASPAFGRVITYDSCSKSWKRMEDETDVVVLRYISERGNIYSMENRGGPDNACELLMYVAQEKAWIPFPLPRECDLQWALVEGNDKVSLFLGQPKNIRSLAFFELQDSGFVAWPSDKSTAMLGMFEALNRGITSSEEIENVSYLGLGKYMFFRATKTSRSGVGGLRRSLRVGFHEFSTNTNVLSDWTEFTWLRGRPTPDYQIFEPSLQRFR